MRKKTALLSAYDKTGLDDFARELVALGFDLLGSAGTRKYLNEKNIPCRDVADIVGPPILGHRVVTLSREIHAGLLARDTPEDLAELERIGVPYIDLVYVDLYPLEEEIAKPDCTLASVIEKTDIGGPTMLRSAAKGRRLAISSPDLFEQALEFLKGEIDPSLGSVERTISWFASLAEERLSRYCEASANFHSAIALGKRST